MVEISTRPFFISLTTGPRSLVPVYMMTINIIIIWIYYVFSDANVAQYSKRSLKSDNRHLNFNIKWLLPAILHSSRNSIAQNILTIC